MEEPPLVSDWRKLTKTPNVVVVPFFISDGLHSYEDIPRLLGIAWSAAGVDRGRRIRGSSVPPATRSCVRTKSFGQNPYKIDDRLLFYAPSIGTDPGFADIIIEQALCCKKLNSCSRSVSLREIAFPRMKETTCKKLQEIGGFALAGGCTRKRMKQLVEMIRAARDYRWVGVYKIIKDEFVIMAESGERTGDVSTFPD